MAFTGRTETTAELGVREGYLVTTPFPHIRTDRDRKVSVALEEPGINTTLPHRDGHRKRGGGVGGAQGFPDKKQTPPPPVRTEALG